jgi:O-antigen/teichoic acid export membrane protein
LCCHFSRSRHNIANTDGESIDKFGYINLDTHILHQAKFHDRVAPILTLPILGNSIRYFAASYSAIVSSVGEQNLAITAPLVERAVNLIVSVVLVQYLGIIGVAIGAIVGGLLNILLHFNYNLPRTKSIMLPKGQNLWKGIARPLVSTIPAILLMTWIDNVRIEISDVLLFSLCVVVSIVTITILV